MNLEEKVRRDVRDALAGAAAAARAAGEIEFNELPDFVVEAPREKEHGDLASNLALTLARQARKPPRQLAEILLRYLDRQGSVIREALVAGPGFINFSLDPVWLYEVVDVVAAEGENYGKSDFGAGRPVQVEFVSANPTGLLHMGNARGAALGDSIAALLEAVGYKVTREFYINDAGNQIANLGLSLEARYLQALGLRADLPEEGYHGQDIMETAQRFVQQEGEHYLKAETGDRRTAMVAFALSEKLNHIRQVLERFGVRYDVWFNESALHESGCVDTVLEKLTQGGTAYEKDGALWFRASDYGSEKDEVLRRKNGIPTYFAADIAYHLNKFERGFERIINIWGADHHGHVARLRGAMQALGYDSERLTVVLMQLVRLIEGGEVLRMSKRTGNYVTLEELLDKVGSDAARFFFVMRGADSHLDFDLDLARSQSAENPVFYVQYAHARICSIFRQAVAIGLPYTPPLMGQVQTHLFTDPNELDLLRKIAAWPQVLASAALNLEPHRLTHYAQDLAAIFHVFYTNCRVLIEDADLRLARLALADATRVTLANALRLIGVTVPERM